MTDLSSRGDPIHIGLEAKIRLAVNIEKVQRDKDGWILPERH